VSVVFSIVPPRRTNPSAGAAQQEATVQYRTIYLK